jgi:hypothetical protein
VLATDRDARLEERRREHKAAHDPWSQRVLNRGAAPIAFAVGVVLNLPGAFYLVALKDIAQGQDGVGRSSSRSSSSTCHVRPRRGAAAGAGLLVAPEATQAKVEALNGWMARPARQIVIVVATTIGLYLVARGVLGVL